MVPDGPVWAYWGLLPISMPNRVAAAEAVCTILVKVFSMILQKTEINYLPIHVFDQKDILVHHETIFEENPDFLVFQVALMKLQSCENTFAFFSLQNQPCNYPKLSKLFKCFHWKSESGRVDIATLIKVKLQDYFWICLLCSKFMQFHFFCILMSFYYLYTQKIQLLLSLHRLEETIKESLVFHATFLQTQRLEFRKSTSKSI